VCAPGVNGSTLSQPQDLEVKRHFPYWRNCSPREVCRRP